MKINRLIWMCSLLILLVMNVQILHAQTNRGSIRGTVADQSGAVVPNAAVTVTNIGTNQSVTLTTSEDGAYSATSLEPVEYRITVEAAGFNKVVVENVKVDTSSSATVNISLEVGGIENIVTVESGEVTLNAENGTVGQTITERQITDIPLNDRSVLNLLLTLPNVTGDLISEVPSTGTGILTPGQGLSIGGGRPGSTSFLADGVNNTSSGSGRTVASFSPDTVKEFNVQTSNYSAEYGQTTGGIVNVTTKSGTNDFHGSIYYFRRDPRISAAPFTIASVNRPESRNSLKEFGGTIGGPIFLPRFGEGGPTVYNGKDRSFFFFAFEPRRIFDNQNVFALFPTAAQRGGDFSNTVLTAGGVTTRDVINSFAARGINIPITGDATIYQQFNLVNGQLQRIAVPAGTANYQAFANNVIPTQLLDPTALRLLQYLPLPNQETFVQPNGNLANYVGRRNVIANDNRYQFRLDHRISDANTIYGRYSHIPITGYRFNNVDPAEAATDGLDQVNALIGDAQTSDQIVVSDTHIFSPTLVNEVRAGYSRGNFSRVNPPRWQTDGFAQQFGLPSVTEANLPFFTGFPFRGIGNENITLLGDEIDETYQLSDTLTWVRGNQTWKFGTDLRYLKLQTAPISNAAGGTYSFSTQPTSSRGTGANTAGGNAFASFLLGVPASYAFRTTVLPYNYRWASGALFFQDDWKVRPNLTLNLGIRYALQLPRWEKDNLQGTFLPELAVDQTLTDAQRRSIATAIGVATTAAIPDTVPTTARIVPFGFSGRGEQSRYLTPIDYNGWEPRFGFAWTPNLKFVNRILGENALVIRGGYGLSHSSVTGQGSTPLPDFASGAGTSINFNSQTAANPQGVGQCDLNFNIRLSSNAPCLVNLTREQLIGAVPADGLIYQDSLKYGAFVTAPNTKTPRSETWNVTAAWEFLKSNILELTYTGNRGSNLFIAPTNQNIVPFSATSGILGSGLDPASTVADPLGRRSLTGAVIAVPRGSLLSPYLGFTNLPLAYNSIGDSIRHAGSAYLKGRLRAQGLTYTVAYTWSKSIDTASDSGSNAVANVFSSRSDGNVRYGAPLESDRAVSSFDVPHSFSSTFLYDLPFGRGNNFFSNAGYFPNLLLNGFTLSGTVRIQSGYPFAAFVQGNNGLDANSGGSVRLDINPDPSVPFKNPLYDRSCPVGTTCQPYINPAKFIKPAYGTLGNGPRTYGDVRGPVQKFFDLSLQKNIYLFGKDKSKRLQLRLDAINVFNMPNFGFASIGGGTGFTSGRGPNSNDARFNTAITTAEYDSWVAADASRANLVRTTPLGAQTFAQVQAFYNNNRVGTSTLVRPDFYSIAVPNGFTQIPLNEFNITTEQGYKLYRLSQAWDKNFGTLSTNLTFPRRLQYSIKFYF